MDGEEILEILLAAPPGPTALHAFGGDGLPDPAGLPTTTNAERFLGLASGGAKG